MIFVEKLIELIKEKKSVVCMGLDPRMDNVGQIPNYLIDEYNKPKKIITEFNKILIDNTYDLIPVIKPQIAFYEKYDALKALKETINYAHKKDLLVILDSKRNDIGTTSEAYAYSTFNVYNADACTLNAYFGIDGIKPYMEKYKEKGLFVLVKTSNPSSREFQNLFSVKLKSIPEDETETEQESIKLERNYLQMAKLVKYWGNNLRTFSGYHNLGIVVGATFPRELKIIREITTNSFILIPGYGVQGAQAKDIKYGFRNQGLGAIINSSRDIIFAYHDKRYPSEKFGEAAREAVIEMNERINKEIEL
ncbi:MAG: orotidine-5'-phosphate decarboxylase [Candidatus Hodarchaeota archaeon]